MAPHSSILAWKIQWTEEPGRLQSMGSLGVGHDWATSLSLFTFVHWRRKWQPTPVFLPGESQGRGSLVGCRLQSRTRLKRLSSSSSSSLWHLQFQPMNIQNYQRMLLSLWGYWLLLWNVWSEKTRLVMVYFRTPFISILNCFQRGHFFFW